MKNIRIEQEYTGGGGFDTLIKVADDTYITPAPPYPSEGVFLLDANAAVLDKNVESYPSGTIKAYGFKAGDGNYYAVDAEAIPDTQQWGGFNKLIDSLESFTDVNKVREDYAGESNTTKIIEALADYDDGYTTGAPAAEACRAKSFAGRQGFLPALGQLYDFWQHKSEVDSLVSKFSLDVFQTDVYHWSSTQYSAIISWGLNWGNGSRSGNSRYIRRRVRAFFAL